MGLDRTFPFIAFELWGIEVYDSVVVTWVLMAVLTAVSWAVSRRLRTEPTPLQNALEAVVESTEALIAEVTSFDAKHFIPLIGTLGCFLVVANSVSALPGVGAPTRDLNTTVALALIVFASVHVYGWRLAGPRAYLRTYLEPSPLLLPFNVIGEITRTLALALRLFGNMLSGELVVAILLLLSALLVPVPMQLLGLLIGVIQAYVFTLLAMVYIAAALGEPTQSFPHDARSPSP